MNGSRTMLPGRRTGMSSPRSSRLRKSQDGISFNLRRGRDSEAGFITLMVLIILGVLSAVTMSAVDLAVVESGVSERMYNADRVRQVARNAARIVGGVLAADKNRDVNAPGTRTVYSDVGVEYDGLDEAWFHITRNSSGVETAYDLGNGAYFDVVVFDMSGRTKPNAIVGAADCVGTATTYYGNTTDCAREMVDWLPCLGTNGLGWYINNDYWTAAEMTQGWDASCGTTFTYSANFREINASLSPFNDGSAPDDYKINVNTADVFDDLFTNPTPPPPGDPPDVMNSAFKQFYSSTSSANDNSRRMVRRRRSACTATGCDDVTYNPSVLDWNPVTTTANFVGYSTATVDAHCGAGGKTMCSYFRRVASSANYGDIGKFLMTSKSAGWFLAVIEAWIVKDPAAGAGSARAAEYNVFTVVYRTATGARTEQWREWFVPAATGIACTTYDECNSLMLHDAPYVIP